jgi:hypothetical protein
MTFQLASEDSTIAEPPPCLLSGKFPNLIGMYLKPVYNFYLNFLPQPVESGQLQLSTLEGEAVDPGVPVLLVWEKLAEKGGI